MRQALAGMLWSKQFYDYDVDRWLADRGTAPSPPATAQPDRATTTGRTWSATTSSRCRTSGSTPGARPGTSRFTRSRWRSSIPTSPSSSSCCCCRNVICTRTGRSRPTSGTSATSIRPFTPGPPTSSTSWTSAHRPGRPRVPQEHLQKLLLNFTWWVNRKDPDRTQRVRGRLPRPGQHRRLRSQRAAARPAATWSRRTAPRGWRSTPR